MTPSPSAKIRAFLRLAGIFFAFFVLCSAVAFQAPAQAADNNKVRANLEDVLLEDFIRFFSRYTGRNIIYRSDQIPNVKFNIYSQEAISEPELAAIFHEVLSATGLSAVAKGEVIYVFPRGQAKAMLGDFESSYEKARGQGDELVTTVYQLDASISPNDAAATLKGMLSPVGNILPIPQAQALLVQDTRQSINHILDILNEVQHIRPKWDFELLNLDSAEANKAVQVISSIYDELVKRKQIAEGPLLRAIEWSNSVLFAGTEDQKDNIRALLARVDRVEEGDVGFIRVYRLQSAKAETLSNVLQSLVEAQVKESKEKEKKGAVVEKDAVFKVSADKDTNSIVVLGTKEVFTSVDQIVKELDQPRDQVYVESMIMETTLNNSRRFGVEWTIGLANESNIGQFGYLNPSDGSLLSYAAPVIEGGLPNFSSLPGGFSMGVLGNIITYKDQQFPTLGALIDYTKSVDEINILSTPQLMTMDHAEAEVFVGENRPYQTGQVFQDNGNTNITYDYRDVGIRLKITPHINKVNDFVHLEVEQEVKKVSQATTDVFAPVTLNRYTKTSVQLLDGATMVISGMIQDDMEKGRTGMPGLASVPVLGWLFKRENVSAVKSTLMVFISARIVRSLDHVQSLSKAKMDDLKNFHDRSKELFEDEFDTWGFESEIMSEDVTWDRMSKEVQFMELDANSTRETTGKTLFAPQKGQEN